MVTATGVEEISGPGAWVPGCLGQADYVSVFYLQLPSGQVVSIGC